MEAFPFTFKNNEIGPTLREWAFVSFNFAESVTGLIELNLPSWATVLDWVVEGLLR